MTDVDEIHSLRNHLINFVVDTWVKELRVLGWVKRFEMPRLTGGRG
jgi:hypothetical protein